MSFRNISWKTGDWVDVTRMNQHMANDQYLSDLFSKLIIYRDSKLYTETIGPNLNQVYLTLNGVQFGSVTSVSTDPEYQYYNVETMISNIPMDILPDGIEYDIAIVQGNNSNYLTSFIKSPAMDYMTLFLNITRWDGTWGRMNLMIMTTLEQLAT